MTTSLANKRDIQTFVRKNAAIDSSKDLQLSSLSRRPFSSFFQLFPIPRISVSRPSFLLLLEAKRSYADLVHRDLPH